MHDLNNCFATYNPFQELSQLEEETDASFELGDQFTQPEDVSGVGIGEDEHYEAVFTTGNNMRGPLTASYVEHIPSVPAYPVSSENGYAYVVPITKTSTGQVPSLKQVLGRAKHFQYSKNQQYGQRETTSPFLNNQGGKRWKYNCSGIKHCQYLANTLQTCSHYEVDNALWDKIKTFRPIPSASRSTKVKEATSVYIGANKRFRLGHCVDQKPTCGPILRQMQETLLTGPQPWFIGCKNWHQRTKDTESHGTIGLMEGTDVEYLKTLFENGLPAEDQSTDSCFVVEPTSIRGSVCGINHPQGTGNMVIAPCPVSWDIIIPNDFTAAPYFVLISFGMHSHVPPPPSFLYQDDVPALEDIMHPMLAPGLTRSQFLNSDALKAYLGLNGYRSVKDFHDAFSNKDRISSIIKREKLNRFPYGGELQGVVCEQRMRHQSPETAYIRKIISGVSGNLIICMHDRAARILVEQLTFQMDMSYKRLRGKWVEILIALFDSEHNEILTLGRIILDGDNLDLYYLGISNFFQLVEERSGRKVEWRHHFREGEKRGFYGTTLDMCSKQSTALGLYLQSCDPEHRDWRWQLSSCTRFCQAYFTRSIDVAIYTDVPPHSSGSVWGRTQSLSKCKTRKEYDEMCNLLVAAEPLENVQIWAINKKNLVVAAGLVRCYSNMSEHVWNTLESHTNAAEVASQKGYRTGTKVTLLEAIQNAEKTDLQDIWDWNEREWDAQDEDDTRYDYQSSQTLRQWYFANREREAKRKAKDQDITELSDDDDFPTPTQKRKASRPRKQARSTSRVSSMRYSSAGRSSPIRSSPALHIEPSGSQIHQSIAFQRQELELEKRELQLEIEKFRFEKEKRAFELEKEKHAFELEKRGRTRSEQD